MTIYRVDITDRNYLSWSIYNANTNANTNESVPIEPSSHKLFAEDEFFFNKGKAEIVRSPVRCQENIPAVLVLHDNKTYGRENSSSLKKGKLLYKCIPNDIRIPIFLVPYEMKQIGFSKVFPNIYVTIRFKEWDSKHPHGYISQIIGPVDINENFYEYQLYCKQLNISMNGFNKATRAKIKDIIKNEYKEITPSNGCENENDSFIDTICAHYPQVVIEPDDRYIFSIDPDGCLDIDDAVSIRYDNDSGTGTHTTHVSIYIANVPIWLDYLQLWSSFAERVSTIYLPNGKKTMLPGVLSDGLCSLAANKRRFAFALDMVIDTISGDIIDLQFRNVLIKVSKNYIYEEKALLTNPCYQMLLKTVTNMRLKYPYIDAVNDSHDVVSYLMICMNYFCSQEFVKHGNGIFRATIPIDKTNSYVVPDEVKKEIKGWSNYSGTYIDFHSVKKEKETGEICRHEMLNLDSYIHITSPIRRLVDLLNMIQFDTNRGTGSYSILSQEARNFYDKWLGRIDAINRAMRDIKRVQNDCNLLDLSTKQSNILEKVYEGYSFDKQDTKDGLYEYTVYLPELRIFSRVVVNKEKELTDLDKRNYQLYVFQDEARLKRKIRLQVIT